MQYQKRPKFFRVALFVFALACAAAAQPAPRPAPKATPKERDALIIKVGIIAYDNYKSSIAQYGAALRDLARVYSEKARKSGGQRVVFEIAAGSYGDVLDWYNKEYIHVAFLTPQPVAELRSALGDAELDKRYVASHAANGGEPPAFEYTSIGVVEEGSPIKDAKTLREKAREGKVNFLFVDPISTSGRILPEYLLRSKYGINNFRLNTGRLEGDNAASYTYTRTASQAALLEEKEALDIPEEQRPAEKHNVAFFYDGKLEKGLRKVDLPELEAIKIPEEVVLVTRSFLYKKRELEDILQVDRPGTHFQKNPYRPRYESWLKRYDEVSEWVRALKIRAGDEVNQVVTLERIGKILRNYESQHDRPARLALVLSGGGAKCAYQLGAIEAIESELINEPEDGERKVDIDLVVGTSGGAINALTVALGVTRDSEVEELVLKKQRLKETWLDFDQTDFLSPLNTAYLTFAFCSSLLQALLVIWLAILVIAVGRAFKFDLRWLYQYVGFVVVGLAVLNAVAQWRGWQSLPTGDHYWRHFWLLLSLNLYITAAGLALFGGAMIFLLYRSPAPAVPLGRVHFLLRTGLLVAIIFVGYYSVFVENNLSDSKRIEATLTRKIAHIMGPEAEKELDESLAKNKGEALWNLTKNHIIKNLQRDLVITGSQLKVGERGKAATETVDGLQLPPDIYFFRDYHKYPHLKNDAERVLEDPEKVKQVERCDPNYPLDNERRFQEVDKHLLDIVIGSSSIYPVFPPRELSDFGAPPVGGTVEGGLAGGPTPAGASSAASRAVKIIDGGFAHNSPIEAAVMWKATHIILIEASPTVPMHESHLLGNALNAFNHLYFQAQLLDARSRGKVEIFTLRPSTRGPNEKPSPGGEDESDPAAEMCTFDFFKDKIQDAIERGNQEAIDEDRPRFIRQHGQPLFVPVDFVDLAYMAKEAEKAKKAIEAQVEEPEDRCTQ